MTQHRKTRAILLSRLRRSVLIREYANHLADGFLSDLTLAEERRQLQPGDEEDLLVLFYKYVASAAAGQPMWPVTV